MKLTLLSKVLLSLVLIFLFGCNQDEIDNNPSLRDLSHEDIKVVDMIERSPITRVEIMLNPYTEFNDGMPWTLEDGIASYTTPRCNLGSKTLYPIQHINVAKLGWKRVRLNVKSIYQFPLSTHTTLSFGDIILGDYKNNYQSWLRINGYSSNDGQVVSFEYDSSNSEDLYVGFIVESYCENKTNLVPIWIISKVWMEKLE